MTQLSYLAQGTAERVEHPVQHKKHEQHNEGEEVVQGNHALIADVLQGARAVHNALQAQQGAATSSTANDK